ncbi:MAG: Protein GrpE [Candidatus Westeberhardia cardiocondylae]|nr:Protein GrpE [Candidatus Westeberhardia cardiocondylae]
MKNNHKDNNTNTIHQENKNQKIQQNTKNQTNDKENSKNLQHILKLEKKIKKEKENLLRAQAEIENIQKRNEKKLSDTRKFALENFITHLLPVIDNLERALETLNKSANNKTIDIEGIKLTLKSLLDVAKKFGLETIDKINITFNPEIHQAMNILETNEHEPNKVIMMMQKGYIFNGRLIRPAMVTVSKNK